MNEWYNIKERAAGKYRLAFLWGVYKIFNLTFLKVLICPIVWFIYLFAKPVRAASLSYQNVLNLYAKNHHLSYPKMTTYQHVLSYAHSLADKMSAISDKKTPLKFTINGNEDWQAFQKCIFAQKGVFLISSHLGNVEAFCAFKDENIKFEKKLHALMEISQNSIFHNFVMNKCQNNSFCLYPTEKMDFDTVMRLYENLCEGDILLMAGDRVSAENPDNTLSTTLLDKKCLLPMGTFRFAKSMKHPVFAIVLLYVGHNTYEVNLKQIDTTQSLEVMAKQYCGFIENNLLRFPEQWYNFYDYFK